MNGEVGNEKQTDDVDGKNVDTVENIDTVENVDTVENIDTFEEIDTVGDADNVGDMSVELNVEELVADVESSGSDDALREIGIKKRLDEMDDQLNKDDEFGSTYNFDVDEDLPT